MDRKKTLILIHGRGFKPDESDLKRLWTDALIAGVARDLGEGGAAALGSINTRFVYYGDMSNAFLARKGRKYNRVADTKARQVTLDVLKDYAVHDFSPSTYKTLRGRFHRVRTWLAGFIVRVPLVRGFAMWVKMPDMAHYWWKTKKRFGIDLRNRLASPLRKTLEAGDDVMIISHSLGTIVAYDVLSEFSHPDAGGELIPGSVSHLVTLGSPLGVRFVQRRLRNWRTYPSNITAWDNVTAKDDYVALDTRVGDDFKRMKCRIRDRSIYSLAVKDGSAHQHHATGYLIHPEVVEIVNGWLHASS